MTSRGLRNAGVRAALASAALFGCATPAGKVLLADFGPWVLAGLLYLGSGVGLTCYRWVVRAPRVRLAGADRWWLAAAVGAGGVVAPVLALLGLTGMPAAGASLLLNAEAVLTAALAWLVFGENVDRRVGLGMVAIVAGVVVLSWPGTPSFTGVWPVLAVLGACLFWAIDNNLTRRVSLTDATWVARTKGLVAGTVNLGLALAAGSRLPNSPIVVAAAGLVGFLAYGVSLSLFVIGLRELGTARAGAYFAVAPFVGAVVSVAVLGEPLTWALVAAGALMGLGVWLHLSERHVHEHTHQGIEHDHPHRHDDPHHQHGAVGSAPDSHAHIHPPVRHSHEHYPDSHHRHPH